MVSIDYSTLLPLPSEARCTPAASKDFLDRFS
jgi:hypothetical protein